MPLTPRLQVLICTHGAEGLKRVAAMHLPRVYGVSYLISCQEMPQAVPQTLSNRDDVLVKPADRVGLGTNRNQAFAAASAELLLIADDDLRYDAEGLLAVIRAFDEHPEVEMAFFKHLGPSKHRYPSADCEVRKLGPRYYPCSFEIALRRSVLSAKSLRFNDDMGAGCPVLGAGEEDVFVHRALEAGVHARFFNTAIVTHAGLTTGSRHPDAATLRGRGAALRIIHPLTSPARAVRLAALLPGKFWVNLRHIFAGWRYAGRRVSRR